MTGCRALPVVVGLLAVVMMLTATAAVIGGPAFTADPPVLLTSGGQSADLRKSVV